MFYDIQPKSQQNKYKKMLSIIGSLTRLFSESNCPYLPYRAHENAFCKYFEADNLARQDSSADAKKHRTGIGLKTWTGQDDQKIAEFGRLRESFANLSGIDLVRKIAEYRNERIRVTKNFNGIDDMIYHIVKRVPGAMQILEHSFDYIDIENIQLIRDRGNANNTYFTDGYHTYHFSSSKNTLYMIFENMELLDSFEVEIMEDPYSFIMNFVQVRKTDAVIVNLEEIISDGCHNRFPQLCLRLYSQHADGTKYVPEKSGLNQWNAAGRRRNPNEIYIPYQKIDRDRNLNFFPPRDTVFNLTLPDGTTIPAKVCQEADPNNPSIGKAVMSNPNKVLGKWLLRNVFELDEGTIVTYEMLERFGVDSVVFTKHDELEYSVDFSEIGTYEEFYRENTED